MTQVADTTIAGFAGKVTQGGGVAAIYGGLTANEWAAFGGLAIAVISALISWAYRHRAAKREAEAARRDVEYHAERMAELKRGGLR